MAQTRQNVQNDSMQRQWDRKRITSALLEQRSAAINKDAANEFRLPTERQINDASPVDQKRNQIDLNRAVGIRDDYHNEGNWGLPPDGWKPGQKAAAKPNADGSPPAPSVAQPTPTPLTAPGAQPGYSQNVERKVTRAKLDGTPIPDDAPPPKTAIDNLQQSMKADGVPLNGLERTGAGFQTMSTPGSGPNGLPSRPVMVTPTGGQLMSAVKATNPDFDSMDTKGKIAAIRGVSGPASRSIPGTTTAVGASDFNSRGDRTVLPGGQTGAPGSYGAAGGIEHDPRYDQFGAAGIAARYGAPPSPGMARSGTYIGDEKDRTAHFTPGGKYATPEAFTPGAAPAGTGSKFVFGPDGITTSSTAPGTTPPPIANGTQSTPIPSPSQPTPPVANSGAPMPNTDKMTGFNPVEQPGAFSSPLPTVTGTGVMSAKALQDNPEPVKSDPQIAGQATTSGLQSAAHDWFQSLGDKLNDVHDYFKGLVGGNDSGQSPGTSGDVKPASPTPTQAMTALPIPTGV